MENMHPTTRDEVQPTKYKPQIVWKMLFVMSFLHIAGIYGLYVAITQAKLVTLVFGYLCVSAATLGVTAGAHRLWTHRSYKATWQARVILMLFQTAALQNSLYVWCRDHRVHHKFSETDADPHNSKRGFLFSHVGWLMMKKHPDVLSKGQTVDMSDLAADPIVSWQKKYYVYLAPLLTFVLPGMTAWYFLGESAHVSFWGAITRYVINLNGTWLVNSAAHLWGPRPYDKNIGPAENALVISIAYGEGFHNYHHTFPWDYKAAELGNYRFNGTTALIDLFALLGWAYDLKTVKPDLVRHRALRTGDGSHCPVEGTQDHRHVTSRDDNDTQSNGIHRRQGGKEECEIHEKRDVGAVDVIPSSEEFVWGWGDVNMHPEDVKTTSIVCPRMAQALM